jgi:protein involved in polysaccharide export with SLBB domain
MKKTIILSTIVFTSIIFSQDISEAYLESLPESVKEDVLKGIDDRTEQENAIYKRPSSMVDKKDSEYAQYKEFKDIQNEDIVDTNVRFGEFIFQSVQSSFMPINEPNFDSSYVLDFGDVIEVQLVGAISEIEELQVNRDGSINMPDIGKIFVSGLSLESANSLIKNKIESVYIGVESNISLIGVRDIQILISGNAYKPGMYTFNGNSSILHALAMAGGINSSGSYRQIDLIRNNKIVDTLDLYEVFIYGKSSLTDNLRSGDTIHIPHHKNLVHAVSGVNRPMIYELNSNESFINLVNYAEGFKSTANKNSLLVERISNGKIVTIELDESDLAETKIKDNDSLIVEEFVLGRVEIKGAVTKPGFYKISENTKLSEIIRRSGGYKDSAYPFGGYLDNKKTAILNEEAKNQLYNKFIKDIVMGFEMLDESALLILESLKETESSGRVMAEFDLDVLTANPELDTRLEEGDTILIPYINEQIYVYGETNNQGAIKYSPGKSANFYISNAGGFLKSADARGVFIIHPNGEAISLNGNRGGLGLFAAQDNELIYPGSIIFVPQKSNLNTAKRASIWAPIISSVALSLTSLSVLNNRNN